MGQKVNPSGLRLGINRTWDSRWYSEDQYSVFLENDLKTLKPLNQGRAVNTLDTIHITSPNMKPFDFISLLPHHCRTYESMVSDMDMGISGKNQVHKGERRISSRKSLNANRNR